MAYLARDNGAVRRATSVNRTFLGPGPSRFARVTASVTRSADPKVRRGDLVGLVVFGVAARVARRGGTTVRLGYNGVVALKKDGSPVATRVYGPVYLEARHAGYARLAVVAVALL